MPIGTGRGCVEPSALNAKRATSRALGYRLSEPARIVRFFGMARAPCFDVRAILSTLKTNSGPRLLPGPAAVCVRVLFKCGREDSNLHDLKRSLAPQASASASSATTATEPLTYSSSLNLSRCVSGLQPKIRPSWDQFGSIYEDFRAYFA